MENELRFDDTRTEDPPRKPNGAEPRSFMPYPAPISETVTRSESIGKLAAALALAQLEFETVTKETENPYYRSRYADLSAIISATQKALAKHSVVIIQIPFVDIAGQKAGVKSLMAHESGEWIQSELILPAIMLGKDGRPRFDSQSCGSAQTYARRYSYQSLIGVAAEPDDDANAGVGIGSKEAANAVAQEKIRQYNEKKKADQQVAPKVLFFIYPPEHNGHYAEFMNVSEYGKGLDPVAQEGLRKVFAKFSKTVTKNNTVLVAKDKMQPLLEVLDGECGIAVRELKANNQREPGEDQ